MLEVLIEYMLTSGILWACFFELIIKAAEEFPNQCDIELHYSACIGLSLFYLFIKTVVVIQYPELSIPKQRERLGM